MNFVDAILYHCKTNPIATAISTPGSSIANVKYGQLPGLISAVAHAALSAGLGPGQTVAIYAADTIIHAVLVLGLMRLGIATMSLTGPAPAHGLAADAVLTDQPQLFSSQKNTITIDASWFRVGAPLLDTERRFTNFP